MDVYASSSARSWVEVEIQEPPTRNFPAREYPPIWTRATARHSSGSGAQIGAIGAPTRLAVTAKEMLGRADESASCCIKAS